MAARETFKMKLAELARQHDELEALLPAVIAELPGQWDLLHQTPVGKLGNYGTSVRGQARKGRDAIRTLQALSARW